MIGTARVAVIFNPAAGSAKPSAAQHIQQELGHNYDARVLLITPESRPESLARHALSDGCDIIIAGGGDGTVGSIAGVLAGTNATLGVLPLGTLNHFARDLGIPLDLGAALRISRYRERARPGAKARHSEVAGVRVGFRQDVCRFPYVHASLKVRGRRLHRRTPFLFIGNNRYEIEGAQIGRRRRLDEGCLSVYTANRTGRLRLLTMEPPLHYRVRPRALRVIVPGGE